MRLFVIIVLIVTAAGGAWAGAGVIMGEFGLGCAGVAAGGVLPALAVIYAYDVDEADALVPFAFTGGAAAGTLVWLGGEWWGGRSANRGSSLMGAIAGGVGGSVAAAACFYAAGRPDEGTGDNEGTWIPIGVAMLFVGSPALATALYNVVKEPAGGGAALTITPAVAALPPGRRGAPPTLTWGVSVGF